MSASRARDGIVVDENTGEKFLPSTQRPDGTWRKPIRVKDGYIPPEEVPVYENRGVLMMKSRSHLPPGLNPELAEQAPAKGTAEPPPATGLSKSAKKNLKRRENKKKKEGGNGLPDMMQSMALSTAVHNSKAALEELVTTPTVVSEPNKDYQTTAPFAEPAKRLKNLKKKLRQIEDLQEKVHSGEVKEPSKEQLNKISRKKETLKEIRELDKQLA